MLTLEIKNITPGRDPANYSYTVRANQTVLEVGKVAKHSRADGWQKLIARVAQAADGMKWVKLAALLDEKTDPVDEKRR